MNSKGSLSQILCVLSILTISSLSQAGAIKEFEGGGSDTLYPVQQETRINENHLQKTDISPACKEPMVQRSPKLDSEVLAFFRNQKWVLGSVRSLGQCHSNSVCESFYVFQSLYLYVSGSDVNTTETLIQTRMRELSGLLEVKSSRGTKVFPANPEASVDVNNARFRMYLANVVASDIAPEIQRLQREGDTWHTKQLGLQSNFEKFLRQTRVDGLPLSSLTTPQKQDLERFEHKYSRARCQKIKAKTRLNVLEKLASNLL